jgi:hypothetical protein
MQTKERETAIVEYTIELGPKELLELGAEMARLDQEIDTVGLEAKASAAGYKARIADYEAHRKMISAWVREKKKTETGECLVEIDHDLGKVFYRLESTGQVVKERELTKEERQLSLFGE